MGVQSPASGASVWVPWDWIADTPDSQFSRRMAAMPSRSGERSGQGRARTADTGLFRAVLYQLSYLTVDPSLDNVNKAKTIGTTRVDQFDVERS